MQVLRPTSMPSLLSGQQTLASLSDHAGPRTEGDTSTVMTEPESMYDEFVLLGMTIDSCIIEVDTSLSGAGHD